MSDFTIEHGHAEYSEGELLEQARENAQALLLATIAFLEARGVPPAEWAAAIGERFSRGWGEPRPWDAGEFLDAMLTNLRAFGAELVMTPAEEGMAGAVRKAEELTAELACSYMPQQFRNAVRNKRQLQQAQQITLLANKSARATINGTEVTPVLVNGNFRL